MSFLTRTPPSLASYKFPLPPSHLPATPPCHTPSATTPPSLLFSTFDFETYGSSSSEYDSCEEEEATTPNSVARDLGRLAFDRRDNDDGLTAGSTPEGIYPSFGDFLPPFEEQKKGHGDRHEERRLSGLGLWLGGLAEESTAPASFSDTTSPPTVFSPFDSKSPNTDSFTFCPPPSFGSTNFDPAPTAVGSSSAALLSPTPSYSPPPPLPCSTPPPSPTYSTQPLQHHSLPSRPQFVPSPSHPRRLRTPPLGSHSLYPSTPPSTPYPLSVSSTQHIALLHHGRVPTLSQLAPLPTFSPVVSHHLSQLPIMNTGNVGPMVVQAGDWHCGACGFTVRSPFRPLVSTRNGD